MNIEKVPESVGREIEIKGWVWRKRESRVPGIVLMWRLRIPSMPSAKRFRNNSGCRRYW